MTPFKAIINDYYARDISKKIRSSLLAKKKEGKWVSGRCPFGYEIDAKNKNHLVINNEKAIIVKKIYEMFLKGISFYGITKILNEANIPFDRFEEMADKCTTQDKVPVGHFVPMYKKDVMAIYELSK